MLRAKCALKSKRSVSSSRANTRKRNKNTITIVTLQQKFLAPSSVELRGRSKDFIRMLSFELSLEHGVFKLKGTNQKIQYKRNSMSHKGPRLIHGIASISFNMNRSSAHIKKILWPWILKLRQDHAKEFGTEHSGIKEQLGVKKGMHCNLRIRKIIELRLYKTFYWQYLTQCIFLHHKNIPNAQPFRI